MGKAKVFPGTFEIPGREGVFKRVWESGFPIRQLYGPNLAVELMRGRSEEVAPKVAEEVMPRPLQHEIGRAMKKISVSADDEGEEE